MARANFAAALVEGRLWNPQRLPQLEALPARHAKTTNLHQAVSWFTRLFWGEPSPSVVDDVVEAAQTARPEHPLSTAVALVMARPEYQLG